MKKTLLIIMLAAVTNAFAQPGKGKEAHMSAILAPGYYINLKGDSVKGEIQTNMEDETEMYKAFNFRPKGAVKLTSINTKKAKGFGFSGRHFTSVLYDAETSVYIERLVNGRLKFYEFKDHGTKNGEAIIACSYYIQDSGADDKEAELRELKPLNNNFYKKELKPYMKAQIMTWNDLDKFTFVKDKVVNAIKEFNKFYETPAE